MEDWLLFKILTDLGVSPYLSALTDETKQMIRRDLMGYISAKPFSNDDYNLQLHSYIRRKFEADFNSYKQLELDFPSDEVL